MSWKLSVTAVKGLIMSLVIFLRQKCAKNSQREINFSCFSEVQPSLRAELPYETGGLLALLLKGKACFKRSEIKY